MGHAWHVTAVGASSNFGGQPDAAEERGPAEALALLERETCMLGADAMDKLRELLERELQAQVRELEASDDPVSTTFVSCNCDTELSFL